MALSMASIAGLRGSSQEVLEGSLHCSRLSTGKTARIAVARPGFRVRAQQQNSAETETETETSRRSLLGFGAAGLVSGSFVQAVLSGGIQRGESMAMAAAAAAATPVVKVAGICGALNKNSKELGLLRAAIEISKSIKGLEIEQVDISALPILNTDLEINGYPKEVIDFRTKVLAADSVLFSSPEYNYSVTGALKNALDWASRPANVMDDKTAAMLSTGTDLGGARSQYHLRQIGVILNLNFINRPELFVNAFTSPPNFDDNGNLINEDIKQNVKELLLSLYEFTLRLRGQTA